MRFQEEGLLALCRNPAILTNNSSARLGLMDLDTMEEEDSSAYSWINDFLEHAVSIPSISATLTGELKQYVYCTKISHCSFIVQHTEITPWMTDSSQIWNWRTGISVHYDFQQNAGIRLVANKLVVHSTYAPQKNHWILNTIINFSEKLLIENEDHRLKRC